MKMSHLPRNTLLVLIALVMHATTLLVTATAAVSPPLRSMTIDNHSSSSDTKSLVDTTTGLLLGYPGVLSQDYVHSRVELEMRNRIFLLWSAHPAPTTDNANASNGSNGGDGTPTTATTSTNLATDERLHARRTLKEGGDEEFSGLNDILASFEFEIPEQVIEIPILGATATVVIGVLCNDIGINRIGLDYDIDKKRKSLTYEIDVQKLDVDCRLDVDWDAGVYDIQDELTIDIKLRDNNFAIGVTLEGIPPKTSTFQGCEAEIYITDIKADGGFSADILNELDDVVQEIVNLAAPTISQLLCEQVSGFSSVVDGLLMGIADIIEPYLGKAKDVDPLSFEKDLQVGEELVDFTKSDLGNAISVIADNLEGVFGAFQVNTLVELNFLDDDGFYTLDFESTEEGRNLQAECSLVRGRRSLINRANDGVSTLLLERALQQEDSPAPSETPTATPTATPTVTPTVTPTAVPTMATAAPSTAVPTMTTAAPSKAPTGGPTEAPTAIPTAVPTMATAAPSKALTGGPTKAPTAVPTMATAAPTTALTGGATDSPTATPTAVPQNATEAPSKAPAGGPTEAPATTPTAAPTNATAAPTMATAAPTKAAAAAPAPAPAPTEAPIATPAAAQTQATAAPSPELFTLNSLDILSIQLTGLNSFEGVDLLEIIGKHTFRTKLELKGIDIKATVLLNADVNDVNIEETIVIVLPVNKIDITASYFVGLSKAVIEDFQIGSLLNTENLQPCILSALVVAGLSELAVTVSEVGSPTVSGLIDSGVDELIGTATEAAFEAYQELIIEAIPNIFQKNVTVALNDFLECFIRTEAAAAVCPKPETNEVSSFLFDFRRRLTSLTHEMVGWVA